MSHRGSKPARAVVKERHEPPVPQNWPEGHVPVLRLLVGIRSRVRDAGWPAQSEFGRLVEGARRRAAHKFGRMAPPRLTAASFAAAIE